MSALDLTLCEVADLLGARRLTVQALVAEAFERIQAADGPLNAVIDIQRTRALEQARMLDGLHDKLRLPLHGIVLAHKDMYHRAGELSSFGAAPEHHRRADRTAVLLERLDDAGAVSLARLNMAEFAMGPTGHNAHFGRCCNPFDPARISGGSSSGSGVAVASRYVFGALGSDTGGSVRLPAAMCGVVGLKPTQGLLSVDGLMPLSDSLDCPGPLARSSRDVARLMDILSGARHERQVLEAPARGVLGVPSRYFTDDLDPDVAEAFERALAAFSRCGFEVRSVDIEDPSDYPHYADVIWKSEAAALHIDHFAAGPRQLSEQLRARLMQGLTVSAADYVYAQKLRTHALQTALDGPLAACDVLLTPAMRCMTPRADEVSAASGERMRVNLERISALTRPVSFLGLPALVTPAGCDRHGMPIGIQLIGRPRDEARLLAVAHAFEDEEGHHRMAPPLG
ncbi:amidase [Salinisphaera sp. T31B1]|uniref:amidase n=1 Tax=Salinisphaera sp. T31B1 TaxID=727963 RepID=UPI00333EBE7F